MEEFVWCIVSAWLLAGGVYLLGLLADTAISYLIYIFRNNGTE